MPNQGFWDRFSQSYGPASRQGAQGTLQMMATQQKRKREDELLLQSQNRALAQMMIGSGDPRSMQQGAAMLGGPQEEALAPLVQAGARKHLAGLSPESFQAVAEAEEEKGMYTDEYKGPYSAEMFGQVTPEHQQTLTERKFERDIELAKMDPGQRAYFTGKAQLKLTDPEIKRVRDYQKDLMTLPGVGDSADVEQSYATVNSMRELLSVGKPDPANANKTIMMPGLNRGMNHLILIQAFQRMADPGVAVREGDIRLIQSAQSIIGKWVAEYKRLETGDVLSDDAVAAMFVAADQIIKYQRGRIKGSVETYLSGISEYEPSKMVIKGVRDYARPFYGEGIGESEAVSGKPKTPTAPGPGSTPPAWWLMFDDKQKKDFFDLVKQGKASF